MQSGPSAGRSEDLRLLTGGGQFVESLDFDGMVQAAFLRAPTGHARITRLVTDTARAAPGVIAVFTEDDLDAAGIRPMTCWRPLESHDGTPFKDHRRPVLSSRYVRHVGEPVAMVIAETAEQALDALDLIELDFEDLEVVVDPRCSNDVAFTWRTGDFEETERVLADAHRIVEMDVGNNRVAPVSLEPRSAVGQYHDGRFTLHTQTQGVHAVRRAVARTLGIAETALRVVTPDVGGSFGMKLVDYPEQTCVLFAARAVGRPVRWVSSRSEAFLSDAYGRDIHARLRLGLSDTGRFLALQVTATGNLGAYPSAVATSTMTLGFAKTLGHVYAIPAIALEVSGVYTNTTPMDAYRGAGKPESVYALERLIDKAAHEAGTDRIDLRRRNLIPPDRMPYRTALGFTYEKSDFPSVLDAALAASGWSAAPPGGDDGVLRGKGIALFVHLTGATTTERTLCEVTDAGTLVVRTGAQGSGQAHPTTFAQLVSDHFGVPFEMVEIVQGDSDALSEEGSATGGSSSLQCAGTTMVRAVDRALTALHGVAATHFEAAAEDIRFVRGVFEVIGTDRRIPIQALLRRSDPGDLAECAADAEFDGTLATLPNGAFVAHVSVERDTGRVSIDRLTCVSDVGGRLNPVVVDGQLVGAAAQGIGQALLEEARYEPSTGQLLTGSLMDYGLPRADDMPEFTLVEADMVSDSNFLGLKGVGELGCIGAPPAIMNAIADAVGTSDIQMPATPERVWKALSKGLGDRN